MPRCFRYSPSGSMGRMNFPCSTVKAQTEKSTGARLASISRASSNVRESLPPDKATATRSPLRIILKRPTASPTLRRRIFSRSKIRLYGGSGSWQGDRPFLSDRAIQPTLHISVKRCVYSYVPTASFLTICLFGVACSRPHRPGPCEMAAVRRIQQINTAETQFQAQHKRFGAADELELPELKSLCEIGYRGTQYNCASTATPSKLAHEITQPADRSDE